jgi:hypothetical protein
LVNGFNYYPNTAVLSSSSASNEPQIGRNVIRTKD